MRRNQQTVSDNGAVVFLLAMLTAIALERGLVSNPQWYWILAFTLPLLVVSIFMGKPYKGLPLRRPGVPRNGAAAGRTKTLTLNKIYRRRKKRKNVSSI